MRSFVSYVHHPTHPHTQRKKIRKNLFLSETHFRLASIQPARIVRNVKPKKPLTTAQRERLAELLMSFETIRIGKKQPRRDVLKRAGVSTRDWHAWDHAYSRPNAGQRKRIHRALDKMKTLTEWPWRLGRKPKLTESTRVEIRASGESVAAMAKRLRVNRSTVYRAIRGR